MCTYHKEKEKGKMSMPPTVMVVVGEGEGGGTSGGVMWLWSWMVGLLACTEELEMPGGGGPIYVEAGTFQCFCLGGPVHR